MAADLQEQAVQVEWKAAKITAAALKGLIEQILANREKITHGEQSLKKLNLQGKKLESIELTGEDMIVGTWKGTFDEWPTADSIYWSYTFSADGTYSFTNGTTTEAGTYAITSDPNNNYYHSSMQLTFDGGERTMQFYFTTTNPVKMITDDQTDPTYLKSLV